MKTIRGFRGLVRRFPLGHFAGGGRSKPTQALPRGPEAGSHTDATHYAQTGQYDLLCGERVCLSQLFPTFAPVRLWSHKRVAAATYGSLGGHVSRGYDARDYREVILLTEEKQMFVFNPFECPCEMVSVHQNRFTDDLDTGDAGGVVSRQKGAVRLACWLDERLAWRRGGRCGLDVLRLGIGGLRSDDPRPSSKEGDARSRCSRPEAGRGCL